MFRVDLEFGYFLGEVTRSGGDEVELSMETSSTFRNDKKDRRSRPSVSRRWIRSGYKGPCRRPRPIPAARTAVDALRGVSGCAPPGSAMDVASWGLEQRLWIFQDGFRSQRQIDSGCLSKSPLRSMSAEDKSAGDDAGDRQFAGHATTPLSIRIRSNLAVPTTSALGARAPRLFYRSLPLSGACTRLSEMYQV